MKNSNFLQICFFGEKPVSLTLWEEKKNVCCEVERRRKTVPSATSPLKRVSHFAFLETSSTSTW